MFVLNLVIQEDTSFLNRFISFFKKNAQFPFGAQYLYKTHHFFPFSVFTLRCLVPRCCRVTLQPGLDGKTAFHF